MPRMQPKTEMLSLTRLLAEAIPERTSFLEIEEMEI